MVFTFQAQLCENSLDSPKSSTVTSPVNQNRPMSLAQFLSEDEAEETASPQNRWPYLQIDTSEATLLSKRQHRFKTMGAVIDAFGAPESPEDDLESETTTTPSFPQTPSQGSQRSRWSNSCRNKRRATHAGVLLKASVDAQSAELNANSPETQAPGSTESTLCTNCSTLQPQDNADDIFVSSLQSPNLSQPSLQSRALSDIEQQQGEVVQRILLLRQESDEFKQKWSSKEQEIEGEQEFYKQLESEKAKLALEEGGGPVNWGISVQQLHDFLEEIKQPLRDYCMDHRLEESTFTHVCCNHGCHHDHGCATFRALAHGEDPTLLSQVQPNMHTVVPLFIKPRTKEHSGVRGLALTLNAQRPKKVERFISHSWSGRFENFVETLSRNMRPETVVFVCSFALPQNCDVGPILDADLEKTPFAQAHDVARDVWLIVDNKIDVLDRVWVIYEMYLSMQRRKPIHMGLTMAGDDFRKKVMAKARSLDVRMAEASKQSDLEAIMAAIVGEEDTLNNEIRTELEEKVHQQQQEQAFFLPRHSHARSFST